MTANSISVSVVLVMTFVGSSCMTVPQTRIFALTIGDYYYFGDTQNLRSRDEALAYCIDQGGELAKIWNRDIYVRIRNYAKTRGAYWIDGMDRRNEYRFEFKRICQHNGEFLDLYEIPKENLDFTHAFCLSFVRGSNVKNTKIQVAPCNEQRFVICQSPITGCPAAFVGNGTSAPSIT